MKSFRVVTLIALCFVTICAFAAKPSSFELQQTANTVSDSAAIKIINRSDNPDFIKEPLPQKTEKFNTVKTLVPYEDLYKVLQQDIGKYFILPIEEFEALKKAKEAWLASQSAPVTSAHPVVYQIHSARLEGRLEESFAHIDAYFKIDTNNENWHEIPLFWGTLAVDSVMLNGNPTTLKTSWVNNTNRRVDFGKMSQQSILQNYQQTTLSPNDTLSQNNWKDTIFSLPIKGKGSHECRVSFMVPVQNQDDLYTLQFNIAQIPLVFLSLTANDFILSIDSTTFKDFSVDESQINTNACTFIGWLGANSNLSLRWRRKYTRASDKPVKEPVTVQDTSDTPDSQPQTEPEPEPEPEPIIEPLIYARSSTLVSLGETSLRGIKTVDYSISKAPVASFSFVLPEKVDIVSVNADRPHSYRQLKEGNVRKLRVEFMAGREDTCRIELVYEAPVDLTQTLTGIPEVGVLGVERELGTIAIEALTSVEIQPGNDDENPLGNNIYPLDPLEVPKPLKNKATRPVLLAYRQNARPANILLKIKRYQDVNQQTVVADRMEVKTTFTTNQTSNTLISMLIRNNNKQYLQLQLASGTEVISAFRSGKPVKLVAGKNDGKVQIPLEMSQTVGKPVEMDLQVLLKHPVDEMNWRGSLAFTTPLVDIPVSRFNWQIFAPEQYKLYNFRGTVKESTPAQDPFIFRGFLHLLKLAWQFVSSPEALLTFGIIVFFILLILARNLLIKILSGIWNLICAVFAYIFSGKGFRLAELMIVFAVIAGLVAMAIPNFRKARGQARVKACYANMRVLQGAVEMYDMESPQPMGRLDIDRLLKGQYMKSRPTHPEQGCGYASTGSLTQGGVIYCKLHGDIDGRMGAGAHNLARQERKRSSFSGKAMMSEDEESLALPQAPQRKVKSGFGGAKTPGMLPIKAKFVMTSNHYSLQRDLVIADVATDGALLANRTSPTVKADYLRGAALNTGEIFAFVLALFAGLYFISGAHLRYSSKITFAAIIIIVLSLVDLRLRTIGDMANMGLWLAIIGGLIWKLFYIASCLNISFSSPPPTGPQGPESPDKKDGETQNTQAKSDLTSSASNAGKTSLKLLLFIVLLTGLMFSASSIFAVQTREIRVMAPFKELEKVVPTGDRVVIIPEKDYEYLKDIVETEPEPIKAPESYRFEKVTYKGHIEDDGVRFKAEFVINLYNKGWKSIALLTTSTIPSYASIDDMPLSLTTIDSRLFEAYGFITNATGSKVVKLDFFVPLSSSEYRHTSKFNLPMIPVCLSNLELTINERDCEAWIDPGVLLPTIKTENKTTFKALLPPTTNLSFELYKNVVSGKAPSAAVTDEKTETAEATDTPIVIAEKTRITVRELNLLYFKEGFVSGTNHYNLKIVGGSGIASLSMTIPPKIRILKVDNKLIENWELNDNGSEQKLNVTFKSIIRGNTKLTVEFEQEIRNLRDEDYEVPELQINNVEQAYGILGIGCLETLEMSVSQTPQGYSPVIAAEFLKEWKGVNPEKTPYAFKYLRHPNQLVLTISRPEDISQQTAVIDKAEALSLLNEDGYLLTRIVYEVRNNSQQFLKVRLPVFAGKKAELWSTQVAGESVRAGFDETFGVYNLPIVRSPLSNGIAKSFPVEVVYVIKTENPLKAFNNIMLELPQTHLPVSELSWILHLPEGYELMKETGNVDRLQNNANIKFLHNSSYFTAVKALEKARNMTNQMQQVQQYHKKGRPSADQQQDKIFGSTGLLPVKFSIPTTSWTTSFSMLQIEPEGKAPYIEGLLVNPRKGKGFYFQALMIFIGFLAALSLVKLFTSQKKYRWFLFLMIQGSLVAVAIYLKLYQADHFAQLGFSTSLSIWLLYKFFGYQPAGKEEK